MSSTSTHTAFQTNNHQGRHHAPVRDSTISDPPKTNNAATRMKSVERKRCSIRKVFQRSAAPQRNQTTASRRLPSRSMSIGLFYSLIPVVILLALADRMSALLRYSH